MSAASCASLPWGSNPIPMHNETFGVYIQVFSQDWLSFRSVAPDVASASPSTPSHTFLHCGAVITQFITYKKKPDSTRQHPSARIPSTSPQHVKSSRSPNFPSHTTYHCPHSGNQQLRMNYKQIVSKFTRETHSLLTFRMNSLRIIINYLPITQWLLMAPPMNDTH